MSRRKFTLDGIKANISEGRADMFAQFHPLDGDEVEWVVTRIAELEGELLRAKHENEPALRAQMESAEEAAIQAQIERNTAMAEVARRGEGVECHAARPGEGTYECSVHDGHKGCPACRLRIAEAEVARLEGERADELSTREQGLVLSRAENERLRGLLHRVRHYATTDFGFHEPGENAAILVAINAALTPPPAEPSGD